MGFQIEGGSKKTGVGSWIKRGAATQQDFKSANARQEQRAQEQDKARRFWLEKTGEECLITFLDGSLLKGTGEEAEGFLDAPSWTEHFVKVNGRWQPFVCIADEEPCPICDSGNEPSWVAGFTVIDHRSYTSEKTGKVYANQKRLFVCKLNTYKILQKKARKHGGLVGVTFEATRNGPKEPQVGSAFEFQQKQGLDVLANQYGAEVAVPLDYEKELTRLSCDQLMQFGFGPTTQVVIGAKPKMPKAEKSELESEIE